MKTRPAFLAIIGLISVAVDFPAAGASPNAYDTFAKVLTPFVNVLAKNSRAPERAFHAILELDPQAPATGVPEAARNSRLEIWFQAPNKLKLSGNFMGEQVTICRKGQKLWAVPGQKIEALLNAAAEGKRLPPADPDFQIAPFELPFPEKQLVFMPALFRVKSAGQAEVGGQIQEVLDVQLMPELARSVKGGSAWSGRLWVGAKGTLARVEVNGPDSSVAVRVTELKFVPELPKQTWSPAEGEDALTLPPSRYDQLVRAIMGQK